MISRASQTEFIYKPFEDTAECRFWVNRTRTEPKVLQFYQASRWCWCVGPLWSNTRLSHSFFTEIPICLCFPPLPQGTELYRNLLWVLFLYNLKKYIFLIQHQAFPFAEIINGYFEKISFLKSVFLNTEYRDIFLVGPREQFSIKEVHEMSSLSELCPTQQHSQNPAAEKGLPSGNRQRLGGRVILKIKNWLPSLKTSEMDYWISDLWEMRGNETRHSLENRMVLLRINYTKHFPFWQAF